MNQKRKETRMNRKLIETVGGYRWPYIIKDDGDVERVRKLLADSGVDTSRIIIME